ncbi:MAG TPA: DUF1616 domain-containing protein, partial [Candidatus Thermoplasmatota archaeon]|nr:DUF1616 domain-containing protein [Candidatus Thermoplasmatota archaeon]
MLPAFLGLPLAIALFVALPGWLLVNALFPRRDALRTSERIYLSVAGGIFVTMLLASILGFLPHGGRGALQSFAIRGMPNVELMMIAACLGLFWAGVARGAYPTVASRFPRIAAPWAAKPSQVSDQQP